MNLIQFMIQFDVFRFPVICFKYIYKECDDVSKNMMM